MTPACPPAEQLQSLLDGSLSPTEDRTLSQHIEGCPACQQELERLLAADPGEALRSSDPEPAGLDLASGSLVRRLQGEGETVSYGKTPRNVPIGLAFGARPGHAEMPLPEVLGYEVLGEIGRGGMGVVYQARHLGLQRIVALKMLRAGDLAGATELSRFRTEAETVASLQHPHIVQVYDVGTHAGLPFLSLEFVAGGSLRDRLQGIPQPAHRAAQLVETLARAMAYAHERGVVHRDLKPANVLLVGQAFQPGGNDGVRLESLAYIPKITDFGLAKLVDSRNGNTQTGTVIGTPSYMAPEQAGGNNRAVGPAADVYALGAILYELLTGRPPFSGETPLATLLQVLHTEPVPPGRLRSSLPRDLETICLKCLEKDPSKRYGSALDLAEDLRRFQAGEAITARPVSPGERLLKWARRRPAVAGLTATVVLTVMVAFVLVTAQWRRAEEKAAGERAARKEAEVKQRQADRLSAASILDLAITQCEKGEIGTGLLRLLHSLELAQRVEDPDLERVARWNLGSWSRFFVRKRGSLPTPDWVSSVAVSPDGRWLATGGKDGFARLWDARTCQPVGEAMKHADPVWDVAFSPDSRHLLTGTGPPGNNRPRGKAQLWEVPSGRPASSPLAHDGSVFLVGFHPDGATLMSAGFDRVQLWQRSATPNADGTIQLTPSRAFSLAGGLQSAAFSRDGRFIAAGGFRQGRNQAEAKEKPGVRHMPSQVQIWDASTGQPLGLPLPHDQEVTTITFSPDSRLVLTGSIDRTARLWHVPTGQPACPPLVHRGFVLAVAFSPDGKRFGTGSADPSSGGKPGNPPQGGEARVWRTDTGLADSEWMPHLGPVRSLAFSPNGRLVLTGAEDGMARLWQTATGTQICPPLGPAGAVLRVAFSRDGRLAVTGSATTMGIAGVWEVPDGLQGEAILHDRPVRSLAFRPDGSQLATGSAQVELWETQTLRPVGKPRPHPSGVNVISWSRDNKTILTNAWDREIYLWEDSTGRLLRQWAIKGKLGVLAWSRIDPGCVVVGTRGGAQIWELASEPRPGPLLPHGVHISAVAFSSDGTRIATGSNDRTMRLWDAATGQPLSAALPLTRQVEVIAWGANDQTIITGDQSGMVQTWEVSTGKPQGPPMLHPATVRGLALDRTGRLLATICDDSTARLWDVATSRPLTPPWPHHGKVLAVAFHPHDNLIATGCVDHYARLLRIPEPVQGEVSQIRAWVETLTDRSIDAQGAIQEKQ